MGSVNTYRVLYFLDSEERSAVFREGQERWAERWL
jgi:hypothetical protein